MNDENENNEQPEDEGWIELLQADTPEEEIHTRGALNRAGKAVYKDGAPLMLSYVTARFVQDRLDAAVGPANWSNAFESLPSGAVRAGISIRIPGTDEWVTKWDVGIPSNIEPDKGAHSDAFKRAGVLWEIARDLYDVRDEDRLVEPAAEKAAATALPRAPAREAMTPSNGGHVVEYDEEESNGQPAAWVCPTHDDVKIVPAGISKRTGRKYSSFYACPVAGCDEKGPSLRDVPGHRVTEPEDEEQEPPPGPATAALPAMPPFRTKTGESRTTGPREYYIDRRGKRSWRPRQEFHP